jgi:hypothetical protein
MPARQRIAVAVLFGLGFIVTIAGIIRTWFIYRSLFGEYDQTWYAYPLWIAAAIEIDLGVVSSEMHICGTFVDQCSDLRIGPRTPTLTFKATRHNYRHFLTQFQQKVQSTFVV